MCNEDHCARYKSKIIGYTWSMVADFYKKIHNEIEFRKIVQESNPINPEDISRIFSNLHISRDDFEHQKIQTQRWYDRVRNH